MQFPASRVVGGGGLGSLLSSYLPSPPPSGQPPLELRFPPRATTSRGETKVLNPRESQKEKGEKDEEGKAREEGRVGATVAWQALQSKFGQPQGDGAGKEEDGLT